MWLSNFCAHRDVRMLHVERALNKLSFDVPIHGYNVTCDVIKSFYYMTWFLLLAQMIKWSWNYALLELLVHIKHVRRAGFHTLVVLWLIYTYKVTNKCSVNSWRGKSKKAPNCHFGEKTRFCHQANQHDNPDPLNHTNKGIIVTKIRTTFCCWQCTVKNTHISLLLFFF